MDSIKKEKQKDNDDNIRGDFMKYKGVKYQGRSEGKWLRYYGEKDKVKEAHKKIKTPFGNIVIDFETDDYIAEIKSPYTYADMRDEQKKRYKWISKHIKPVKIFIDKGNNEDISKSWKIVEIK